MKKIFICLLLASGIASASTLECQSLINLDVVSTDVVTTALNVKTPIQSSDDVVSYVTEIRADVFLVEAFLPSLEMRIYSEGLLQPGGELKASAWARSLMVDVVCKKLK